MSSYPARLSELEFSQVWYKLPEIGKSIDPFDFNERIGAYKLLIDNTSRLGLFGDENQWNIFWGYVFQLHWQWRTGRLQLSETPPGRIAANSPWGYANYSLSIIPLVAAMQVGIVPEKEILLSESSLDHISGGSRAGEFKIPPGFETAMREWREFFTLIKSMRSGADIEPIRFKLWRAHFSSLATIEPFIRKLAEPYSEVERDFLTGWIRMVDFLGTAAWRTDLEFMLENGTGILPHRLLRDDDNPGKITDMDVKVNANLINIIGLAHQTKHRFGFNLWLWKRAMRSRAARDEVVKMLDATFNPSPRNAAERRKLLHYLLAW